VGGEGGAEGMIGNIIGSTAWPARRKKKRGSSLSIISVEEGDLRQGKKRGETVHFFELFGPLGKDGKEVRGGALCRTLQGREN